MFTLKRRKDAFRLIIPKEFIPAEINEKYSRILKESKSFFQKPIDFLNETIQKVDVLGFTGGTVQQQQPSRGTPLRDPRRVQENNYLHMAADVNYRNVDSYLKIFDRTLNVEFRHTLGHLNYFLILESFIYHYSRDTKYDPDLDYNFKIELLNENGATYSNIILYHPLIDGLDMLSFDNTSSVAQTESFKCAFKYNNFDYQFINTDPNTAMVDLDAYIKEIEQDHPFYVSSQPMQSNMSRIPAFKSNSPLDYVPGGLPYEDNWNGVGNGQIFYEDEGGILKDIVHHDRVVTSKKFVNSGTGESGGESGENNSGNDGGGSSGSDSTTTNVPKGKDKDPDPGSFIDIIANAKMEYSDGLAENEKFWYYPYDKDYENRKRKLSTFDISETLDKSQTKVDENGEATPEYPDRSEWPSWQDTEFQKFRHKK